MLELWIFTALGLQSTSGMRISLQPLLMSLILDQNVLDIIVFEGVHVVSSVIHVFVESVYATKDKKAVVDDFLLHHVFWRAHGRRFAA